MTSAGWRELPHIRDRVLVIDDEQPILTTLVGLLQKDHELVTAASGEAGRAILAHDQSFDVILCDLMMPGMSGMDVHAWAATHHPTLAERIVFVTGGAFTPTASEYVTRVGNLRLDKPYEAAKLRRLISDRIVSGRSGCVPGPPIAPMAP